MFDLRHRLLNRLRNGARRNVLPGLQPGDYICVPIGAARLHTDSISVVMRVMSIARTPWVPGGSAEQVEVVIMGPKDLLPRRRVPNNRRSVTGIRDLPIDWLTVSSTEWLLNRNIGLNPLQLGERQAISKYRGWYRCIGSDSLEPRYKDRWELSDAYVIHREPLFPLSRLKRNHWILFSRESSDSRGSRPTYRLRWGLVTGVPHLRSSTNPKARIRVVSPLLYARAEKSTSRDSKSHPRDPRAPRHNLPRASAEDPRDWRTYDIYLSDVRSIVDGAELRYVSPELGRNPVHINLQKWDYVVYSIRGTKSTGWVMETPSVRSGVVKIWSEARQDYVAHDDDACGVRSTRDAFYVDRQSIVAVIETASANFDILTPQRGVPKEIVYVLMARYDNRRRSGISYSIEEAYIAYPEVEQQIRLSAALGKHRLFRKDRPNNDLYLVEPLSRHYFPTWYSRKNVFLWRADAQARLDLYNGIMSEERWCRKLLERNSKDGTRTRSKSRHREKGQQVDQRRKEKVARRADTGKAGLERLRRTPYISSDSPTTWIPSDEDSRISISRSEYKRGTRAHARTPEQRKAHEDMLRREQEEQVKLEQEQRQKNRTDSSSRSVAAGKRPAQQDNEKRRSKGTAQPEKPSEAPQKKPSGTGNYRQPTVRPVKDNRRDSGSTITLSLRNSVPQSDPAGRSDSVPQSDVAGRSDSVSRSDVQYYDDLDVSMSDVDEGRWRREPHDNSEGDGYAHPSGSSAVLSSYGKKRRDNRYVNSEGEYAIGSSYTAASDTEA